MRGQKRALNTSFEVGLRIIMLLVSTGVAIDFDRIVAYDFIATHAGGFGLADESLNGSVLFTFGELPAHRRLATEAIRGLVLDGFVDVRDNIDGIVYGVSQTGREMCSWLQADNGVQAEYATAYMDTMLRVHRRYRRRTGVQLADEIAQHSIATIKEVIA